MQPDHFLETYRSALGRLQTACRRGHLEGIYTIQRFGAQTDRPEREATMEIAYSSDGDLERHGLIRRDLSSTRYFERVFLPRNGRTLWLERLDPAGPFYIRWISDPDEDHRPHAPNDRRDKIARASYSIGGGYLMPAILSSPSIQIIEIGHAERDGVSLVRAAFKCQTQSNDAESLTEMDGWLLLDPERDWALVAHEVRMAWPAVPNYHSVVSGTVRYSDGADPHPFPEEMTLVDRFRDAEQNGERRIHFRARHRASGPPSAEEFSLADYDLGDYPFDVAAQSEEADVGQWILYPPFLYHDRPAPDNTVELSFQLTNSGPKPVRVVGMRYGCAAILPAEDLPCQIEPGQIKRLSIKLQSCSEADADEIESSLFLYTTAPGQAEVKLTLVGRRNAGDA